MMPPNTYVYWMDDEGAAVDFHFLDGRKVWCWVRPSLDNPQKLAVTLQPANKGVLKKVQALPCVHICGD